MQEQLYKIRKGFYEISYNFTCWKNIIRNPYNNFASFIFFSNLSSYQNPKHTIFLSLENYDSLVKKLNEPAQFNESIFKLLQKSAPWDSK